MTQEPHAICVRGVVLIDDWDHVSFEACRYRVTDFGPALLLQEIALTCSHDNQACRCGQAMKSEERPTNCAGKPLTKSCAILSPTVSKSSEYLERGVAGGKPLELGRHEVGWTKLQVHGLRLEKGTFLETVTSSDNAFYMLCDASRSP